MTFGKLGQPSIVALFWYRHHDTYVPYVFSPQYTCPSFANHEYTGAESQAGLENFFFLIMTMMAIHWSNHFDFVSSVLIPYDVSNKHEIWTYIYKLRVQIYE